MTPEGEVKKRVKKILDQYKPDCWYFMPAARAYGQAGIPDFIGVYGGRMFAIETKAGNNKPTELQLIQAYKINEAGGKMFIIREDNVYQLSDWMRTLPQAALKNAISLLDYNRMYEGLCRKLYEELHRKSYELPKSR